VEYFGGDEKTNKTSNLIMFLTISLAIVITTQTATAQQQWNLEITDLAGKTTTMTYDQIAAMPQTTVDSALYCYGALVTQGKWTGVKLSYLLTQVELDPSATSIELSAQDSYRVVIPAETAMQEDVILAYQMDSTPLNEVYRLVIPNANGAVWIAQIISISMGTDVAPPPQSQSPALTDALKNAAGSQTTVTQQPTPKPTTVQPNPTVNPTQTPHNQVTPSPTNQATNITEIPSQSQGSTNTFLFATAATIAAVLAVTGIAVYKRKKR
jgi:hypothetical protein